jgi:hypothetical protein
MKPVESLGISARLDGANGYFDPYQESNMKTSNAFRTAGALGALAVTQIALVSGASAQATAVQWRVEDGGNGHWYRFDPTHVNWEVTRSAAMAAGGDLACVGSQSENAFVRSLIPRDDAGYIGAIRTSNGWQWVSGETWNHESWNPGEPNGATVGEVVWLEHNSGGWNDHAQANSIQGSIIEWSTDCNSDGIIDYGQCLDGSLPDTNSNNIPDCCEEGIPCSACYAYDLNPTGIVDGADLGALLAFWGPVSPAFPRADINRDGFVNGADLGILLANWGPCRQ